MACTYLSVDLPPAQVLETLAQTARSSGFQVVPLDERSLAVKKGSFFMSVLFGAFIAYCDFKASATPVDAATTRLSIQRNTPWWTGVIGVQRVKRRANELVDALSQSLAAQGRAVTQRAEA